MGENKQISQVGEFQMICRGAPPSRRGRLIPLIKLRLGASQLALVVKNLLANAGDLRDLGSVPGLGRSPGRGHGNPLQYACPENPMDKGAWRATVHGVTKSWTLLKGLSMHACKLRLPKVTSFQTVWNGGKCMCGGETRQRPSQPGDQRKNQQWCHVDSLILWYNGITKDTLALWCSF